MNKRVIYIRCVKEFIPEENHLEKGFYIQSGSSMESIHDHIVSRGWFTASYHPSKTNEELELLKKQSVEAIFDYINLSKDRFLFISYPSIGIP